jgi:hypothetical protein
MAALFFHRRRACPADGCGAGDRDDRQRDHASAHVRGLLNGHARADAAARCADL